jgi:hypothetical protein
LQSPRKSDCSGYFSGQTTWSQAALSLTVGTFAAPALAATQNSTSGAQATVFKVVAKRGANTLVAPSEVGTLTNQSVSLA